jgi:hypothetical protein
MLQQATVPTIGEAVIASDGEILGDVVEVREHHFRIGVSFRRDYWLAFADISTIEQGAVCLNFPKDDLDGYKQREPAAS